MTIGDRIKAARETAQMTQAELGNKIGVSGVAIMRYEKDQRQPRIEQLKRIASVLKMPLSELVGTPEEIQTTAFDKLKEANYIAQSEASSPWEKQRKLMETLLAYTEVQNLAELSNAVEEQNRNKRKAALDAVYNKLNSICQEKVLGYAEGLAEDDENLIQYITLPSPFPQSSEDQKTIPTDTEDQSPPADE